jgi:uncharacterized membrane protein (DUF4010 family)
MNEAATLTSVARLAVAMLIGLLVGLDRERAEERKERQLFAGVRTFPMIALAGCVPMLLIGHAGPLLLLGALLAVAGVTVVAYARGAATGDIGATTEIAAIATFLLGALAGAGELVVAGAAGVAMSVLLVAKPRIERFSLALSQEEVSAVLQLAVISVIILPVLPNRGFGPWEVLNPREIWWVVVLVAALSFAGFIAARLLGDRVGLLVAGAIGGLVSSTAVTMSMAERSKEHEQAARSAVAAAVVASVIMCGRVLILAAAVDTGILARLAPAMAAMAAAGALFAWLIGRPTGRPDGAPSRLRNPFSLRQAVIFAVVFAAVLVAVRAAQETVGTSGLFVVAGASAVADVDAATIAVTRNGPGPDAWRGAAAAVTLAVVVNTLVKLGLAAGMGAPAFRRPMALALGGMAAVGAAAGAVIYWS